MDDLTRIGVVADGPAERRYTRAARDEANQARRKDDKRKGNAEEEDCNEGSRRQSTQGIVLERSRADPHDRLRDDREYGSLQPEKQTFDCRHVAEQYVDVAERQYGDETRQHEETASDQAAARLMEKPADIDCKLLRFRPRQQHAVVQCVQKSLLTDPALLVYEDAVHDGDLSGRATERQGGDARPDADRVAERDGHARVSFRRA